MLSTVFKDFGLSEEKIHLLKNYLQLLKDWNQKINLISFHDDSELIIKHFYDSAVIRQYVDFNKGSFDFAPSARGYAQDDKIKKKIIDIGTGGGLPGLILAILYPEINFTLVDSVQKKIKAVQEMAKILGLKNVEAIAERLEVLGKNVKFRGKFDFVVARALAPLPILLEYASPFLPKGGQFVAYKSANFIEELNSATQALTTLKMSQKDCFLYELPHNMGGRSLIVFEQIELTPKEFPRKVGMAKKSPL